MNDRAFITPSFGIQLQDLVRKDRGMPTKPRLVTAHTAKTEGKIFVMLLEDLESGKRAKAAWLAGETSIPKQMITAYGELNSPHTEFKIDWNDETVSGISVHSTALELKAKLEEFSFIEPGAVGVFFGNHLRSVHGEIEEFQVFRWIVQIHNGADQFGLMDPNISSNSRQAWMGCEATDLEDTRDTIEVRSVLPVGVDIENKTPMQRGAIGTAFVDETLGWCVDAIEARSVTTDFIELPIYGIYG
jgi:hypothetical protein